MQKIAREARINRQAIRRMAKEDLNLMPYKLQKVQILTEENKRVQLERCRQLKRRAAGHRWERDLLMDEKLFTVEQPYNRWNNRSWSARQPLLNNAKTPR